MATQLKKVWVVTMQHAKEKYDGHFTLLKFTTNYRFCFGTLSEINPMTTALMAEGRTPEDAMWKALKEDINAYDIEEKADGLFSLMAE